MLHCAITSTCLSIQQPGEWDMSFLVRLKIKNGWDVDITATTFDIYNPTIDTIRALCLYFDLEII